MISLPPLTSDVGVNVNTSAQKPQPVLRPVEPVGRYFLQHAQRTLRNHTWSEFEKVEAEKNAKNAKQTSVDPDELLFDDELADVTLLAHDPRDWKTADLYAAMGLSKLRYRATPEQIIKSHRKQVLKHHPDKKSAHGGLDQDGFFKIIQKAYETLIDPTKRSQYDSCDPQADVQPPQKGEEYDFFEAWGPVLAAEARFSKKKPIPSIGDINTPKKEVESFYTFWHRFDSWRTFEFADEDVPDDSSNRDHKRYIERKNKANRDKKKTADNARLVKLVERLVNEDPRIRKFKEEEKQEKERKKWERDAGARAAAEAKKKAEEEAKAKAEADAVAKEAAKVDKKKLKEAAKAAKKKNKRAIRSCAKEAGYFGDEAQAATIDEQLGFIVDTLDDEQLVEVAEKIKGSPQAAKETLQAVAKQFVESSKLPAAVVSYFSN